MIKNICLWVLSLTSCAVFGAASSQISAADWTARSTYTPDFIRLVHGKNQPEVSMMCVEGKIKSGTFRVNHFDTLVCLFLGYSDQQVSRHVLNHVMQEIQASYASSMRDEDWSSGKIELVRNMRTEVQKSLSVRELIHRGPLFTAALFMDRRTGGDIGVEMYEETHTGCCIQNMQDLAELPIIATIIGTSEYVAKTLRRKQDHALRPGEFYRSEYAKELLRRIAARECESSALDEAFNVWVEQANTVGIEINIEGMQRYFDVRAASDIKARM